MHIYTRTGDKGETSLIGGKRVPKYQLRIETYGTVDELIAYIGLLRDQNIQDSVRNELIEIQDKLMVCASLLAADCDDCDFELPQIYEDDIKNLEESIDKMDVELPPLQSFVLPGGHPIVSYTHIARNVCRRAERYAIRLYEDSKFSDQVLQYLNRLSDYLFMLARKFTQDFDIKEVLWKPKTK
jgi:cob(I)alamin adenosyltransferase